jgi:RNA polymerase sigma factor for flagellar operon FliA
MVPHGSRSTELADGRIVASLPFVESLARRMAASMPSSVEIGDLVQDGVLGLIDAAHRFDEARGIKFETFAERRVRGAMIDALRRDSWPRGVRRRRRELEAARESLRRELGCEPSLADLAARVGSDEKRLSRTIVRITMIESTSSIAAGECADESIVPQALLPSEPEAPDSAYEKIEIRERIQAAIRSLPGREQQIIQRYYTDDATMRQIGAEIRVNESRVSQLHARALRRLREALDQMASRSRQIARPKPQAATIVTTRAAKNIDRPPARRRQTPAVVLPMPVHGASFDRHCRTARSRSTERNGFASQRQPLVLRKRSAPVPATSPVTKMTRLERDGERLAKAR